MTPIFPTLSRLLRRSFTEALSWANRGKSYLNVIPRRLSEFNLWYVIVAWERYNLFPFLIWDKILKDSHTKIFKQSGDLKTSSSKKAWWIKIWWIKVTLISLHVSYHKFVICTKNDFQNLLLYYTQFRCQSFPCKYPDYTGIIEFVIYKSTGYLFCFINCRVPENSAISI